MRCAWPSCSASGTCLQRLGAEQRAQQARRLIVQQEGAARMQGLGITRQMHSCVHYGTACRCAPQSRARCTCLGKPVDRARHMQVVEPVHVLRAQAAEGLQCAGFRQQAHKSPIIKVMLSLCPSLLPLAASVPSRGVPLLMPPRLLCVLPAALLCVLPLVAPGRATVLPLLVLITCPAMLGGACLARAAAPVL